MPYADVLRALKALFAKGDATPEERARVLDAHGPGLSPEERAGLLEAPASRVGVYSNLVRENQASMLNFAARSATAAIVRFCGVPETEVARATLFDTPRRTGGTRELTARLLDHLRGAGREWTERCPPVLDLARLDHAYTEAFYAFDDAGALSPEAFERECASRTVDDALRLEARAPSALRSVRLDHDVVAWRERWFETATWSEPLPARVDPAVEVLVTRDPVTLQPASHRVDAVLVPLLLPQRDWRTLESLAQAWVEAAGADPQDETAAARFFEQVTLWVRAGLLVAREAPKAPERPPA